MKDFLDDKELYKVTNAYKQEYISHVIVEVTVNGEYQKSLQSEIKSLEKLIWILSCQAVFGRI